MIAGFETMNRSFVRVAISDFTAFSHFGNHHFLWNPECENPWRTPPDPAFSPAEKSLESRSSPGWEWAESVIQNAGLSHQSSDRIAVSFGSSKGWVSHLARWAAAGEAWPFCDFDARSLAARVGAGGAVLCPVAACATGAHALALGAHLIETGRADVVFAGASEPPQPEILLASYKNMGALSRSGVMRPFDTRRDGFLPAHGSALFVLESEERARQRGATIRGFLSGTSMHCDASHITAMNPSGDAIARAIEDALRKAGNPRIDYINAHGTATRANDIIESRAIAMTLGTRVRVSSTKPLTGHLLGAAGAVEAAICLLAMRDNLAPPTLNLENVDSEIGNQLNLHFLWKQNQKTRIGATLSLSYGFGGHIGALVFEKN